MKTIKLILKAILFYSSILFWVILITGIDSILDSGLFWTFFTILVVDIIALKAFISSDDIDTLTFNHN